MPATRDPNLPRMLPDDDYNRALVAHAHPPHWKNPTPAPRYNLVVLGAGTAGLVSAIGAASLGARVAIVERHLTGGDCLNFGCVPSKALISAAREIATARRASRFGLRLAADAEVDFAAIMARMRRLRAEIAPNDSVPRLAAHGVDVFLGNARFVANDAVDVDGRRLTFRRAVIATGGRPAIPEITGLADSGYLTNETVFSLTDRPRHLIVIGAGPVGCELAQAFRRFGCDVTVVGRDQTLLPREDGDAKELVAQAFSRDGIRVLTGTQVVRVDRRSGALPHVVMCATAGVEQEITGDAILVAAGRAPNVDGLELQAAGIASDADGVRVNDALQTTNSQVYAAGDICSRYKFTHAADAMARIALQNALFFGRKKASALVIPRATYTDPEVAHVGISAAHARQMGDRVVTLTHQLRNVDRAILDDQAEGFGRVHVEQSSGRILGATLVAAHAGELISEMAVAMQAGVPMKSVSAAIHPYPTQSEVWKRLGDEWNRRRLTPGVRRFLERLLRWRS